MKTRRKNNGSRVSQARRIAYLVCSQVRGRDAYVHNILYSELSKQKHVSPEDKSFAVLLSIGVTQSWGTLDELINRCLLKPTDIKDDVRDALRISTYEIIFLDKQPHAAVDQGVELVRFVNPKACGLANMLLRKMLKLKLSFPFDDPNNNLTAFSYTQAFPLWLSRLFVRDLGEVTAKEIMRHSNGTAPLYLALMGGEKNATYSIEQLKFAGADPCQIILKDNLTLCEIKHSLSLLDARVQNMMKEGSFLISDAAAQYIASLVIDSAFVHLKATNKKKTSLAASEDVLNNKLVSNNAADSPTDDLLPSVLEIGSGRGNKSICMQNYSYNAFGHYVNLYCVDNVSYKVDLLRQRCIDYGVPVNQVLCSSAKDMHSWLNTKSFDAVFVDAPCSGLGTLRRHPEIRWRIKEEDIIELASLQLNMLKAASKFVKGGGALLYSTCTLTQKENREVVEAFLKSESGDQFRLWPIADKPYFMSNTLGIPCDLHFAVRFIKEQ